MSFPSCLPTEDDDENLLICKNQDGNEEEDEDELKTCETVEDEIDPTKAQNMVSNNMIMTPEEQDRWLGKYFSSSANDDISKSMDDHMSSLEKEFEESMQLAAMATPAPSMSKRNKNTGNQDALSKVFAELQSTADPETIDKLRMAMECIPDNVKGLQDCKTYFASKQNYTLQDILAAQYVLNDGLLMRQNHGSEDEYHVDIAEPLV